MRFPNEHTEGTSTVPYIRSMNPGSQWYFHTQGEQMVWEVDCPALGHGAAHLNTIEVVLLMDEQHPSVSGRNFHIPSLDSPLFYSLRAAAQWALAFEFSIQNEAA
jgi:hypothetical protein